MTRTKMLCLIGVALFALQACADDNATPGDVKVPQKVPLAEGDQYGTYPQFDPVLDKLLLAKAPVDECFNGIGQPITYPDEQGNCATGVPKVNESYVWGLTKSGSSLWFGTAANVLCGVLFGYLEVEQPVGGVGSDYVCERSVAANPSLGMPARSDSRVPSIYELDLATRELKQHAGPKGGVVSGHIAGWTSAATTLLSRTGGFRSAGSLGNTVILAGAGRSLLNQSGINVFAFDAATDTLIGTTTLLGYSNIRKWFTHDGVLYTGVGAGASLGGGGQVLRWNGPADPLGFTQVGTTGSEIAELVVHEGRLFGASWPLHGAVEVPAGLYMSPLIPPGGLPASTAEWQMVWQATDYDPDPVTASTYGTGALESFDGYLYWGTMHVPGRGAIAHEDVYGEPATQQEAGQNFINTLRAITIFRGRNFGMLTPPEMQVVYGESELTAWDAATSQWVTMPTGMGAPIWGPSGFGNPFNNYTWTMEAYEGALYIGTMDWSYLAFGSQTMPAWLSALLEALPFSFGADMLRIESSAEPGVFESVNGAGNYTNYGIRTMKADTDGLFLGSANPMNLMTSKTDAKPEGGWEIIRARPQYSLALAPAHELNFVGAELTVQAKLTLPKANVTVSFNVTGANAATGTVTTDANGVATFSYTGGTAGIDQIEAVADVMGYGWPEDQLTDSSSAAWLGSYATIGGNAKIGKKPVTFSGLVGDAGGTPLGFIKVNYGGGKHCMLKPDADSQFVVTGKIAMLHGWASDDLGSGGCAESADVDVTLVGADGSNARGSIVIDINPESMFADIGELGLPTPLALTGGKVVVVCL